MPKRLQSKTPNMTSQKMGMARYSSISTHCIFNIHSHATADNITASNSVGTMPVSSHCAFCHVLPPRLRRRAYSRVRLRQMLVFTAIKFAKALSSSNSETATKAS